MCLCDVSVCVCVLKFDCSVGKLLLTGDLDYLYATGI